MQPYDTKSATKWNPYGLSPAMFHLWKEHMLALPTDIRRSIHAHIAAAKRARQKQGTDQLAEKLSRYGNAGGWAADRSRELARNIYFNKRPASVSLGSWISVEIECILPSEDTKEELAKALRRAGLSKAVTVKSDGSISLEDGEDDLELIVTFQYGDWDVVTKVCELLGRYDARVNSSCGLHVHFDFRHLESPRHLAKYAKRLAIAVPALKQMLPHSRRNNHYCEANISKGRGRDARYAFINTTSYRKHKTLEVRGHSGTTNATKIINWIEILRTIMHHPKRPKGMEYVEQLLNFYPFPESVKEYIKYRAAKFISNNADEVNTEQFRYPTTVAITGQLQAIRVQTSETIYNCLPRI